MKKITFAIVLTLLVNILCLPLWTDCDYVGFVLTLFNKEARLDLLYCGETTQAEPAQCQITPQSYQASWFYQSRNGIQRLNLNLRARGEWQKISLYLKVKNDGKITMHFRGPDVHNDYVEFHSVLTDWRNIKINGMVILPESKVYSFVKSFTKQISIKKGDIIQVEGEFRRHHFTIRDFTFLKPGILWYFITGNLLLFFLVYRLLGCIQGGGIRICDGLFLSTFFTCLCIPITNISDVRKSVREKRVLAAKPKLKEILKKESDYGKKYESWFNDHFYGRIALTKLHDVIRNKISCIIRAKGGIYFKENGWMFRIPLIPELNCTRTSLQASVQNLINMNEFCRQNNIKMYVLEVPRKEIFYKDVIKKEYGFDEKTLDKVMQAQEFIRDEARKHRIPYVCPYKALRDASKKDFVFFKWTNHWTDWGAFIGYRELMKEVTIDFPDMPVVFLNDYRKLQSWLVRDDWHDSYSRRFLFYRLFNYDGDMTDFPNRVFYNYYYHQHGDKMVYKVGKFTKNFAYPGGKRKIMLMGTSHNDIFSHFLPYSAAQMKYVRLNLGQVKGGDEFKILKLYKKDILAFKPDILILSISTDDLSRLRDLCSTK